MANETIITNLCNLTVIAEFINRRQHAGMPITPDLWSDLYQRTNEAKAAIDKLAPASVPVRKWLVEGTSTFATGFIETVTAQTEEEARQTVCDQLSSLYATVGGYSGVDLQEIDVQSCTVQED